MASGKPLTQEQIEEGRRIIAIQASTLPEDLNIGPIGAWTRAGGVQVEGRNVHERMKHPVFRTPTDRY